MPVANAEARLQDQSPISADNRAAFKSVFRQFMLLCKRLDLFGRELLAADGTRIKAVNNKDRNVTRNLLEKFIKAADERLADYLRLHEGDAAENATSSRLRPRRCAATERRFGRARRCAARTS